MITIKLTDAQQSALECGMLTEDDDPLLFAAWSEDGTHLRFSENDLPLVLAELIDLVNAEDAANNGNPDAGNRGARLALNNLYSKVKALR